MINLKQIGLMLVSASCSFILHSCHQSDDAVDSLECQPISIEAAIEGNLLSQARYASSTPESMAFTEGDQIGLFVDGKDLLPWTYTSLAWTAGKVVYWPSKTKASDFQAFYPYAKSAAKESVPMPDLKTQNGTMSDVAAHDFMVATVNQAMTSGATVLFTGEHAFKHQSALIQLTIDGAGDLSEATLSTIQLKGTKLVAGTNYSFADGKVSEVAVEGTDKDNNLTITLNDGILSAKKTYYILINALKEVSDVKLTVSYQLGGKSFTTDEMILPTKQVTASTRYAFTIKVNDAHLQITDAQIDNWTDAGPFEDIEVDGHPVKA